MTREEALRIATEVLGNQTRSHVGAAQLLAGYVIDDVEVILRERKIFEKAYGEFCAAIEAGLGPSASMHSGRGDPP